MKKTIKQTAPSGFSTPLAKSAPCPVKEMTNEAIEIINNVLGNVFILRFGEVNHCHWFTNGLAQIVSRTAIRLHISC